MPGVRSTASNGLAMDGQHRSCKRSRTRERSQGIGSAQGGVHSASSKACRQISLERNKQFAITPKKVPKRDCFP